MAGFLGGINGLYHYPSADNVGTSPHKGNGVNLRKKQRSYLLLCHLELVERSFIYQSYGIKRFFTSFRMTRFFDKAP